METNEKKKIRSSNTSLNTVQKADLKKLKHILYASFYSQYNKMLHTSLWAEKLNWKTQVGRDDSVSVRLSPLPLLLENRLLSVYLCLSTDL